MSHLGTGSRGASVDNQRFLIWPFTAVQHRDPGTTDTAYHGDLLGRSLFVASSDRAPKLHNLIMRTAPPGLPMGLC